MTAPAVPAALARLRNIGVIAHIDAGKTTTTDRILYHTGRSHRLGSVDAGTTVTDWMEQERERGITIVAAAVTTHWRDCAINLIDTPGHIDFTAEVQRSLRVLDGGIVVFDGVHGVQPQSETVWRQADRYRVPRLCFVNKMDRPGADFARAVASIEARLGVKAACLQLPLGQEAEFCGVIDLLTMRALCWPTTAGGEPLAAAIPPALLAAAQAARARLIEAVAETDDALLAAYVAGVVPDAGQLRTALRRATLAKQLFPVFCGAARRDVGIQALLDGIVDYLPSPLDRDATPGIDPASGHAVSLRADDHEPPAALVFKIANDAYVGHLAYVRVYAGVLAAGMSLYNATRQQKERIGRLLRMHANHREEVAALHTGEIGAVLGLNRSYTGDSLCSAEHPILLEAIAFPEPVIRAAVEPQRAAEQENMAAALRRLTEEDPTFQLDTDPDSGQLLIAGMGELHLEVLLERVRREFGIAVRMGRPRVNYKETITRAVPAATGRCVRQTGGHGQYGHVVLALEPGARGSGIVFGRAIKGDAVPHQFIAAIEQGVRDAAQAGVLGGYAVADVAVTLAGGSSHAVDSSDLAFRTAAALAFREGLRLGEPMLLEPVVRIELLVPAEFTGAVLAQLSARRATIQEVAPRPGDVEAILGRLPLAETFGYITELRSATQGRGAFAMEFDHYAPLTR
ncbi:MAG: elongation factor G [Rhodocyclales bacterium]|nr:elongation factor G [Rhodocyclales bacterium]